jgi:hypothetical protein
MVITSFASEGAEIAFSAERSSAALRPSMAGAGFCLWQAVRKPGRQAMKMAAGRETFGFAMESVTEV